MKKGEDMTRDIKWKREMKDDMLHAPLLFLSHKKMVVTLN
jgi:hypothetical protein